MTDIPSREHCPQAYIDWLEAELASSKEFRCPDCGGDPKIAIIARAMGHRPDIAFARIAKLEAELAE